MSTAKIGPDLPRLKLAGVRVIGVDCIFNSHGNSHSLLIFQHFSI